MAILIQARMSSSRLPGKMLKEVAGIPLLERVVQRAKTAGKRLDLPVSVLTSAEGSDDALHEACESLGIHCFRGPLEDVALRFVEFLNSNDHPFFVRVNGDSPLLDPDLIAEGVDLFQGSKDAEVVSNVFPRTFPKGQSVEVFCAKSFSESYPEMNAFQREHIGQFFYQEHPSEVLNFESGDQVSEHSSMTVDSPEDFERLSSFLTSVEGEGIEGMGWKQLSERLESFQETVGE